MSVARVFSILIYPMTLLLFLIGPLVVYLVFKNKEDARFHVRNAMNLQLTVLVAYFVCLLMLMMPPVFGLGLAGAVAVYQIMFIIIGMAKANEAKDEATWGVIPFMKPEA